MRFLRWEFYYIAVVVFFILLCASIAQARMVFVFSSPSAWLSLAYSLALTAATVLILKWGFEYRLSLAFLNKDSIKEIIPPLFIAGLSFYCFGGMFGPGYPSTTDHTTHLLRCWLTENGLWRHGTILPWVSAIGAGVPLNDLYPPGGAILYCLLRALTLFLVHYSKVYALTVFVSWFLFVFSIYIFVRHYFGRVGALFSSLLLFIDPGSVALYGYAQCFFYSLWPMELSAGFFILAVLVHLRTLDRPTGYWEMAALALLAMCALLGHIFALLVLLLNLPIFTFIFLCRNRWQDTLRYSVRNIVFISIGLLLAAWWAIPFMSSSEWTAPYGTTLTPPYSFAAQIFDSKIFYNCPTLLSAFLIFSLVWGFFSARREALALSIAATVNLAMTNSYLYDWLFSPFYADLFTNVPMSRFVGVAKLWMLILAGGMIQEAYPALRERVARIGYQTGNSLQSLRYGIKPLSITLFVSMILAPLLPSAYTLWKFFQNTREPYAVHTLAEYPEYRDSFRQAMNLITQQEGNHSGLATFFTPLTYPRIGIQTNILESSIPFEYGYGIVAPLYMPTMVFKTRSASDDSLASTLSAQKYYLAIGENFKYIKDLPGMELTKQFGMVYLLQNKLYDPILCQFLNHTGKAELLAQQPGLLRVQLSEITESSWIRLPITRFRKWRAYLDGKSIPIVEHIEPQEKSDAGRYISLQASNGVLELRYEWERIDWIGLGLSTAAIVFMFMAYLFRPLFPIASLQHEKIVTIWNSILVSKPLQNIFGALFSVAILSAAVLVWVQPASSSRFWYAGLTEDRMSRKDWGHDQFLDLEFGLLIGEEVRGRILDSITLDEVPITPAHIQRNFWSNKGPLSWKIGIESWDETSDCWNRQDKPYNIALNPPHRLRLFVSNPYLGAYIPESLKIQVKLHFDNGTSQALQCPLLPQGYY